MIKQEFILTSRHHQRPFGADFRYVPDGQAKPVVLFVHGFKGFKDLMHFNALADEMAQAGLIYVKMNLSHNGVTVDQPQEFDDLEAFAQNNFSIELDDIGLMIDHITNGGLEVPPAEIDHTQISLIGHSRGGAVSILKACEDDRIKKLITWAAVPDLASFWSERFVAQWKEEGVQHIKNARTHQEMPMYYQMVEDFERNENRFNISRQLEKLAIPFLAIHGTADETVPVQSLLMLKSFYPRIKTYKIEGANHTFGGRHPWTEAGLPPASVPLVRESIQFLLDQ